MLYLRKYFIFVCSVIFCLRLSAGSKNSPEIFMWKNNNEWNVTVKRFSSGSNESKPRPTAATEKIPHFIATGPFMLDTFGVASPLDTSLLQTGQC